MENNKSVSNKKRLIPSFEFSLCMSCSICVQACPFSCLELAAAGKAGPAARRYGKRFPFLQRQESCTGCGICMQACPLDCVTMVDRS